MLANIIRNRKKTGIGGGGGGIAGSISLDYLIVAGGGSGGSGSTFNAAGGGGGAGGVLQGTIGVNVGDTYALTVGTGGATAAPFALGNNGTSSIFNTFTAVGGGAGASHTVQGQSPNNIAGSAGGSGGGGSGSTALGGTPGAGGAGTSGQGNAGGNAANAQPLSGGGGGGAGGAGGASATGSNSRAGAGGAGVSSNITGNLTYYGGGGGGGIYCYNGSPYIGALQGLGGTGGGGNGSGNISTAGANGTANTGGGGGGGSTNDPSPRTPGGTNGGAGGSGIVILKCPSAYEIAEPSGLNYSSALSGGNRTYSFYSGTGNVTFQSAITDPYFSSVSLLLHMDGANGSTTFTDNSANALAVTASGTPTISTSQSVFGGSSLALNGSSYLTVANNAAIAFGLGDFTIECWVNFSALPATSVNMSIANTMTSPSVASFANWWLGLYNAAGVFRLQLWRHGNGAVYAYSNWTPALNTWYHVAVTRSSASVISLFVNGVSQSVVSSGSNWANDFSATGTLSVGYVATAAAFNGNIDEFRLTKGVARYTSNFTPPTSAHPNA